MGCRVALLRMHRRGEITLPAPRNGNGNGHPLFWKRVILGEQKPLRFVCNDVGKVEGDLTRNVDLTDGSL